GQPRPAERLRLVEQPRFPHDLELQYQPERKVVDHHAAVRAVGRYTGQRGAQHVDRLAERLARRITRLDLGKIQQRGPEVQLEAPPGPVILTGRGDGGTPALDRGVYRAGHALAAEEVAQRYGQIAQPARVVRVVGCRR